MKITVFFNNDRVPETFDSPLMPKEEGSFVEIVTEPVGGMNKGVFLSTKTIERMEVSK